jgi:large conductance mechanosensitive channel
MMVKWVNKLRRKPLEAPAVLTTKECPFCCSLVQIRAVRCPNCTSELKGK